MLKANIECLIKSTFITSFSVSNTHTNTNKNGVLVLEVHCVVPMLDAIE